MVKHAWPTRWKPGPPGVGGGGGTVYSQVAAPTYIVTYTIFTHLRTLFLNYGTLCALFCYHIMLLISFIWGSKAFLWTHHFKTCVFCVHKFHYLQYCMTLPIEGSTPVPSAIHTHRSTSSLVSARMSWCEWGPKVIRGLTPYRDVTDDWLVVTMVIRLSSMAGRMLSQSARWIPLFLLIPGRTASGTQLCPENTTRSHNAGAMLGRRRRRGPTLLQH